MNRRARRIQAREGSRMEWCTVKAGGTYASLGDDDGRNLLMDVFRVVAGEMSQDVLEDGALFDGIMTLIAHDLLVVRFALSGSNIHVKWEITTPQGGVA